MTPSQLLNEVQAIGCSIEILSADHPTIRLRGSVSRVTAEMKQALTEAKPEIIRLLDSRAVTSTASGAQTVTSPQVKPVTSPDRANTSARLYMINAHGQPVDDPKQCYRWTRGVYGFRWRDATVEPPPLL